MEVPQAAKERGWASLQRELERRPVRASSQVPAHAAARAAGAKGGAISVSHRRGWLLGCATAAIAVVATMVGVYSAGLLQTSSEDGSTTIASVVTSTGSVTTESGATVTSTPGTTATEPTGTSIDGTVTTTGNQGATSTTVPDTTGSTGSATTQSTVPHTNGTVPVNPTTTQTTSPGTGTTQYASAEREGSAKAVARSVSEAVIIGDLTGARALVAPAAQSALVQMTKPLKEPYGYSLVSAESISEDTVKVTMEIYDRVSNGSGELLEVTKRFNFYVTINGSAVITAITAG